MRRCLVVVPTGREQNTTQLSSYKYIHKYKHKSKESIHHVKAHHTQINLRRQTRNTSPQRNPPPQKTALGECLKSQSIRLFSTLPKGILEDTLVFVFWSKGLIHKKQSLYLI